MYCKHCGREIDDKAAICIYCGVSTSLKDPNEEAAPKKVNGLAIAGFVVSLVSLWLGVYFCIASIVGLVLSIVALSRKKNYTSCNGLGIAGLVIGIVSLVVWAIVWIVIAALGASLFGLGI